MEAYAVVVSGGKQHIVKAKDVLQVEHLPAAPGTSVTLAPVLAASDGKTLKVGTPELKDVKVSATVVSHIRGPKLVIFKKKRRKGSARKAGHRQELTVLKIDSIG